MSAGAPLEAILEPFAKRAKVSTNSDLEQGRRRKDKFGYDRDAATGEAVAGLKLREHGQQRR